MVSVTQFHAGSEWNVIPEEVRLRGTARTFKPAVRDMVERRMKEVVDGIVAAHGATATFMYKRGYPPTVNHERETEIAAGVAVGSLAAAGLTWLMRSILFEVGPLDPSAFAAAVLTLAVFALLACYLSARRATRVDPLIALRHDE